MSKFYPLVPWDQTPNQIWERIRFLAFMNIVLEGVNNLCGNKGRWLSISSPKGGGIITEIWHK